MASTLSDREGKTEYRAPRVQLSLADFELETRLGEGSYALVVQVRQKETGQHFALKVVDKHLVLRNSYTEYIKTERKLLDRLDSPWIVNLHFTFQDTHSLYFVLELCPNGELHDQLQRRGKLPLEDARFYAAEIVLILDYLQGQKIIHRDLKPENLMLDEQGHLKLIDFGSAKDLNADSAYQQQAPQRRNSLQQSQRSSSMVGTAEYLAPEVLRNEATGFAADLWALGCLLYRMLIGDTPFAAASEYLIFERITSHDLHIPDTIAPSAQDILKQLLDSIPSNRIGARSRGISELKDHPFFAGVAWQNLRKQKAPPVKQAVNKEDDSVDWEWSSLAAALPVYTTSEAAPSAPNSTVTSKAPSADSQQHYSEQIKHLPAPGASQQQKSAITGMMSQSSTPQTGMSGSKSRANSRIGDKTSSAGAVTGQGKAHSMKRNPAAVPVPAASQEGKSHSMKRNPQSAPVLATGQHKSAPVRVNTATEPAAEGPADACSPEKFCERREGMPLSPKYDAHKPPASTAHAAMHHKGGSPPKLAMRAPSRRGDFLTHNPMQAAWNTGSGQDDRMVQAAGVMMMNQFFANAHADGRN